MDRPSTSRAGLLLPGGGARGAYQVGVLKAIAELNGSRRNPFPVVIGVSVGAINAAFMAAHAQSFNVGVTRLVDLWSNLRTDDVFRTDFASVAKYGVRWLLSLTLGGLGVANPRSFFDNAPLERLLKRVIPLPLIRQAIDSGDLRAVGISASSYNRGSAVTFVQSVDGIVEWRRARRESRLCEITIDHVLASLALPFMFPARKIDTEYFGDGSLRLTAPLSPAIHLGADKILVIGARDLKRDQVPKDPTAVAYPNLGLLAGYMLDLIFLDNLDNDIERLQRINRTLGLLDDEARDQSELRPIEVMTIEPSQDLRTIAGQHAREVPAAVRMLLRGIGAWNEEWRLPSYILFEPPYIRHLLELGYADAMARRDTLAGFLGLK
jgi:NTE family protein